MAMQFHRTFDRLPSLGRPVVCAIGMFDGFHLGHQKVIEKTLKLAQDHGAMATVLTFQNHPESIVGKGSPPPLIHPSFIRERLFERAGLDLAWVVPFDAAWGSRRLPVQPAALLPPPPIPGRSEANAKLRPQRQRWCRGGC